MKTSLSLLTLLALVATPTAIAVEAVGGHLPASFDIAHGFTAFVAGFILLSFVRDYAKAPTAAQKALALRASRASHALAA